MTAYRTVRRQEIAADIAEQLIRKGIGYECVPLPNDYFRFAVRFEEEVRLERFAELAEKEAGYAAP